MAAQRRAKWGHSEHRSSKHTRSRSWRFLCGRTLNRCRCRKPTNGGREISTWASLRRPTTSCRACGSGIRSTMLRRGTTEFRAFSRLKTLTEHQALVWTKLSVLVWALVVLPRSRSTIWCRLAPKHRSISRIAAKITRLLLNPRTKIISFRSW